MPRALTLLPAVLAGFGPAIDKLKLPRLRRHSNRDTEPFPSSGLWSRWAQTVMKRPVTFGLTALAVLMLAALPLTSIRYGMDMGVSQIVGSPSGQAAGLLVGKFEPGNMSPIQLAATGPADTALGPAAESAANRLVNHTSRDPRVAAVVPRRADGRMLITIVPSVPVDSVAASDLVRQLRSDAARITADGGPNILVGGTTAAFVETSDMITTRLRLVVAIVLTSSLVFLVAVFRSLLLPIKAILMNLLATAAALGIGVAIFQWGHGQSLLDFHSTGFVQAFLPTTVFVILFGLSMDYEVFLIRRVKEHWNRVDERTDEANREAVAVGIEHTGRPITAAAAIMVVVFGCFVTADVLELKQIGFTLAVAIAIDAILIRMVLVPAFMRLFGRWNWWLPAVKTRQS